MVKIEQCVSKNYLNIVKEKIEYKPDKRVLEKMYAKNVADLSQTELEILLQLKKDEVLMEYYERLIDLFPSSEAIQRTASNSWRSRYDKSAQRMPREYKSNSYKVLSFSMTEEEEMMLDALIKYDKERAYEVKILPEVKEYVTMLMDCVDLDKEEDVRLLITAIYNIQDKFLREYAVMVWQDMAAARDELRATSNASDSSRAKKAHPVTGRVPNRIH